MAIEFNAEHKGTDFTTGDVTLHYAHIGKPDKPKDPNIEPAYGAKIVFDKSSESDMAQLDEFKKAVMGVVKSAFPGITKTEFNKLNMPWKDGDADFPNANASFAGLVRGHWVIEPKLKHKRKDGTINPPVPCFENRRAADGKLIRRDASEIVSGNTARVCIRLFAYKGFGGGVAARLKAVQFRDEGEAFTSDYGFTDGTPSAGDAFEVPAEDDDDLPM